MKRVLIVGDSILDVYRDCSFKKECPDAPGVSAGIENYTEDRLGGAANVAANLLSLSDDVFVTLAAVLDKRTCDCILDRLSKDDLKRLSFSNNASNDHSIVKERIFLDGKFIVRVDNVRQVAPIWSKLVFRQVKREIEANRPDLIIVSDYGGGSINQECLDLLLEHRDILLIDTKEPDLSRFGTVDQKSLLIKLNEEEWKAALQRHHSPEQFFNFMVVTRGRDGAILYTHRMNERNAASSTSRLSISGHVVEQIDPCGCGDTFMAGLVSAMLAGSDLFDSVRFANCAAATVVSQPRTVVADYSSVTTLFGKEIV